MFLSGCLICGRELEYLSAVEEQTCQFCGKVFRADVHCPNGHFICDTCHSQDALTWIQARCMEASTTNPLELLITLMHGPRVSMHGPEHHFLVPAALLTAFYTVIGKPDEKIRRLEQAKERSCKVPGGFCGTHGNCGAAVGTGIFISLVTGATPLAEEAWRLSNLMTATSLTAIAAYGGPRCCKRDSFLAIRSAVDFTFHHLGIMMDIPPLIRCDFSNLNRQCLHAACPFFDQNSVPAYSLEI